MDYTIYPYEGVGSIKFGMTPQQVHEILGEPDEQRPPGYGEELPTDYYQGLDLSVFYVNPRQCKAITLGDEARPTFRSMNLYGKSLKQLRDWLLSIKSDVQHYDMGLISFKYGICFGSQNYSPNLECPISTVIAFNSGYFDNVAHILKKYPKEEAKA
jgi:hypothetical protein